MHGTNKHYGHTFNGHCCGSTCVIGMHVMGVSVYVMTVHVMDNNVILLFWCSTSKCLDKATANFLSC